MGGIGFKRRLVIGVAVPVTAALLVVATVGTMHWLGLDSLDSGVDYRAVPGGADPVAAEDIHDVTIDLEVPDFNFGDVTFNGNDIRVIVRNSSGVGIPAVAIDVDIEDPGGDFPEVYVAKRDGRDTCTQSYVEDEPGGETHDTLDEECLRQLRESGQRCSLHGDGSYDGQAQSLSRHARCIRALDIGDNRFYFQCGPRSTSIGTIRHRTTTPI